MRVFTKMLIAFLILIYSSYALAVQLSLNQVFHSVKIHYPIIKAAEESVNIAKAQLLKARGTFDPKIISYFNSEPDGGYQNYYTNTELSVPLVVGGARIYVGYRLGQGSWPVYFQNFLTNSGGEASVGLDLPLLRGFHIDPGRARLETGKLNIYLKKQSAILVQIETLNRAGIAYWRWVEAAKTMQYTKQLLTLASVRQKALERRHHLGDLAHIDSVENKRFIFQRHAALVLAKRNYIYSSIQLSLYYRDKDGVPLIPKLSMVPKDLPIVLNQKINVIRSLLAIQSLYTINPILLLLQKKIEIENVKLKLVRNQLLPELNLSISSKKQYGTGGYPRLIPRAQEIGLRFDLPIPRREAKGEYHEIQSVIRRLRQQQTFARQQLYADFRTYLNDLENNHKQVVYLRQEVKAALEVEQAEIIRFKEGDSSLFLVNQREQTTFSARLRTLYATIAYLESKLDVQRICVFKCRISHGKITVDISRSK